MKKSLVADPTLAGQTGIAPAKDVCEERVSESLEPIRDILDVIESRRVRQQGQKTVVMYQLVSYGFSIAKWEESDSPLPAVA